MDINSKNHIKSYILQYYKSQNCTVWQNINPVQYWKVFINFILLNFELKIVILIKDNNNIILWRLYFL